LSFGYGLFEGRGSLGPSKLQPFFTYSESKSLDRVIRFFKTCPKFKKEVYDNEDTYKESKDYLEMHVPKISQRLGKQLGFNLSNSAIIAMHKACAFESTLSGTVA
jgi:multiple inositol-polyphosphate phosphatase/2,3-bisphosphoglycerate 3-phosphatase